MNRNGRPTERERQRALAALPDYIDVVALGIRAGLSPATALIAAAAQTRDPLTRPARFLAERLERGELLADALTEFGRDLGSDGIAFADALGTTVRYGLPLGPVLDRLVEDNRLARRRQADRYARTLPVRLAFPLVTCTLPGFALCAIAPALLGALASIRELSP